MTDRLNKMKINETGQNFTIVTLKEYCENHTEELICNAGDYIVPTWIHLVLCCVALALNTLCILGIFTGCRKLRLRHHLVISLCTSDSILVATEILRQSFTLNYQVHEWHMCLDAAYESLDMLSHLALVMNMTAMAINYYIAIAKPLHHAEFISSRKPKIMLSAIWTISVIVGCSNFISGLAFQTLGTFQMDSYCANADVTANAMLRYYVHVTATSLCLIINVFSYVNILLVLRRRHHMFDSQVQSTSKHGKAIVTIMLFMITFILLYLPFDIIDAVFGFVSVYAQDYPYNSWLLMLIVKNNLDVYQKLNSIFDPLIYAFRQPDVLNGVKRCLCCCRKHPPIDWRYRSSVTEQNPVRLRVTTEL